MMMHWRKYLPPPPVLPRSLWLTGAVLLLALLSYAYRSEVWPGHPAAERYSLAAVPFAVVVGLLQLLHALRRWPATVPGPAWVRWLLIAGVAVVHTAATIAIVLGLLGSLLLLALIG